MPKIKARTSGIPFADADTPAPSFQRCTACAGEFPSTHSHCPHCAQPAPATIEADSEMNLHKTLISLFVSVITFGFLYLYWFAYIPEKPYEYCIQRADWGKFHEGCTRFSELAEVAIKRKRERAEEKRKSDEEYTRNFKRRVEAQTLMDKAERVWGKGNF
jgi:hypothetical protein